MSRWSGSPDGSSSSRPRPHDRPVAAAGFTLLEVLVAFVVLSLLLSVLLQIFANGFRSTERARKYMTATLLATSTLAQAGVEQPLVPEEASGTFADGFTWARRVELYQEADWPGIGPDQPVYRVTVDVNWAGAGSGQSVTLSTLRFGPPLEDGGAGGGRR